MFSELIKGLIALGVPADNRVNLGFFRVLEADRLGLTIGNRGKKFCFFTESRKYFSHCESFVFYRVWEAGGLASKGLISVS